LIIIHLFGDYFLTLSLFNDLSDTSGLYYLTLSSIFQIPN